MPVPNTTTDKQKLKEMIGEITKCMLRIDAEREAMKEIIKDAADRYKIDKKLVRRIASTMYRSNYADVQAEHEEFETLYETIVEGKKTDDSKVA